jgi:hypothetical protein
MSRKRRKTEFPSAKMVKWIHSVGLAHKNNLTTRNTNEKLVIFTLRNTKLSCQGSEPNRSNPVQSATYYNNRKTDKLKQM